MVAAHGGNAQGSQSERTCAYLYADILGVRRELHTGELHTAAGAMALGYLRRS